MASFYLRLIMDAATVLDVGCGTGELLCRARRAGHRGELAGVDPAPAMLAIARRKRCDVSWLPGRAEDLRLDRRFELVTMTGHAFQELLDDDAVRAALTAFHRHLAPGGRLVFETRNPAARAWERWTPSQMSTTVRSPAGLAYDVSFDTQRCRAPDLVDYTVTFRSRVSGDTVISAGTLRFVDPLHLHTQLAAAGFRVEACYGDWDRTEVSPASPEIIVVATRP